MNTSIRQHEIYRLVQSRGSCSIAELAGLLGVSGETVRRNVKNLVEDGLVARVHGGISLPLNDREPPILKRMQRNVAAKRAIAQELAQLVQDGDTLILDTGSTTAFAAQALLARHGLTVITNSSYIANVLAAKESNRIFMAGGELRPHDAAAFGPSVVAFLNQFEAQRAILSMALFGSMGQVLSFTGWDLLTGQAIDQAGNIPRIVAESLLAAGPAYPVLVPFLGWVGTFLTGYGVASIMLFATLQVTIAAKLGMSPEWLVCGLAVGASVGGISSPFKVAFAASMCGAAGKEGEILRKTIPMGIAACILLGTFMLLV